MTWHSQAGQDEWVIEVLDGQRDGLFVDVGAHDGITHSNTWALERDYGWRGICIEPNTDAYAQLRANRPDCFTTGCAVSDFDGLIGFAGDHVTGARLYDITAETAEGLADGGPLNRTGLVECRRLATLLDTVSGPVDYLSIDVEGHELAVLAGMDFDRWHVRCITIEHNSYLTGPAHKDAIASVLTGLGFDCVDDAVVAPGYGEYESWWVNPAPPGP